MMFKKKILSLILLLGFVGLALAGNLRVKVFNPGSKAIFPISSTIIYGEKDAMLIDAQFQKQYAEQLVKEIKATGKNLKTIFISHSDPDFYFGLDVIKKAFPNSKVISTAQTAYLISASKDDKLSVWKPQLKQDAPAEIIVPEGVDSIPDLEGNKIELKQNQNDPAHSFIWIPSLKTALGGISVSVDSHLWMADTQNKNAIDQWIAQVDAMKALNPTQVIPSHFVNYSLSPNALDFVKNYLENYKKAVDKSENSVGITQFMTTQYPNLAGNNELEMGAKVFLGEMDWDLRSPFPAIGKKIELDFGTNRLIVNMKDHKTINFIGENGERSLQYSVVEVAKNIFMIDWFDPKTKVNVVSIQDYNKNIAYSDILKSNGSSEHLKGKIKFLE